MSIIAFSKEIGPVSLDCFLSERHESNLEITENPVESGATVNDHAYLTPKKVTLDIADRNAASVYNQLLVFQKSRIPFTLVTGLSVYPNMLIKNVSADRDRTHSRVLRAKVDLQEVIIVRTAVSSIDVQEAGPVSPGLPGGANSTRSGTLGPGSAGDSITADRVTSTIQRGDSPMVALPESGPSEEVILSAALFP